MSKRYTFEEDSFIVEYYDGVGSYIGPHDLNRSEASVAQRAAKLKKDGGWRALELMRMARYEYEYLMHPEARGYMDSPYAEERGKEVAALEAAWANYAGPNR